MMRRSNILVARIKKAQRQAVNVVFPAEMHRVTFQPTPDSYIRQHVANLQRLHQCGKHLASDQDIWPAASDDPARYVSQTSRD